MKKKDFLFLVGLYLFGGIISTVISFGSFTNAISIYNLPQQLEFLDLYEFGKSLIGKPELTESESKTYQYLKVISDSSSLLEYLEEDSDSLADSFAAAFGHSFPFVILVCLLFLKSIPLRLGVVLGFFYLFYCVSVNNKLNAAKTIVHKYFEQINENEFRQLYDNGIN